MSEIIVTPDEASAAELVADLIVPHIAAKRRGVLGVATGSSPMRAYAAIGNRARGLGVELRDVRGFALDEYLGLPTEHPERYANVVRDRIEPALGLNPGSIAVPDARFEVIVDAGDRYEKAIIDAGGIDIQILGIGTTGHIGFNEPGSSLASRTRVKTLAAATRRDNSRFFGVDEEVPTHCITQGIGTILEARHLVLIACGMRKARAIALALEGPVSAAHPASALQLHPHVTVVLDEPAASELRNRDYYDFAWRNKPAWQRRRAASSDIRGGNADV